VPSANQRTLIRDLLIRDEPHPEVVVKGWVRTVRRGKDIAFVALNDGSCLASIQVVLEPGLADFERLAKVGTGACLAVSGELAPSPAAGQSWEVRAQKVEVLGEADEEYPLQKKRHSFEFLRSIAHLRPRSNTFGAVFRLRSVLSFAIHKFFQERGFLHVHTPIITANDCEGAGEMFRVTTLPPVSPPQANGAADWCEDFFGEKTGLTVSGQLQGELFATAFGDIYTFGPTSRSRHSAFASRICPGVRHSGSNSRGLAIRKARQRARDRATFRRLPL
jgi:asparaginyl-tRNA synthetase